MAVNLARVEKGEVILDNMEPRSYLQQFVKNYYWAISMNLGTRLLRQEKIASRKVLSLASGIANKYFKQLLQK